MNKLKEMVKKDLETLEEQGISSSNLQTISALVDILKDISEIEDNSNERGDYGMRYPREGTRNMYMPIYRGRNDYEYDGRMGNYPYSYMGEGSYRHTPMEHLFEKMNRLFENIEYYIDGKERYHAGGHQGHMADGLEKTMYAICTLVESLMDSAETAEEKETIRKHIEKIKNI